MNKELAEATIQFLDRVTITGHQERQVMNSIIASLVSILKEEVQEEDEKT